MTVTAAGVALVAIPLDRADHQRAFFKSLAHAEIEFEDTSSWDSMQRYENVTEIRFSYPTSVVVLRQFPRLTRLQTLWLDVGPGFSDDAWQALRRCNQIKDLRLLRLSPGERSLAGISSLQNLWSLGISQGEITAEDWKEIARLGELKSLVLINSPLDDTDMKAVVELSKLEAITLYGANVTDLQLQQLSTLQNLRSLKITDNPSVVTDAGIAALKNVTNLEVLHVNGASITDTSLEHIAKLRNLIELQLYSADVSLDGLLHLAPLTDLSALRIGSKRLGSHDLPEVKKALPYCPPNGIFIYRDK
jgi:hypothetical protein